MDNQHHHIGTQYLKRYVTKFDIKHNRRKLTEMRHTEITVKGITGKPLTYWRSSAQETLVKENSIMPFDEKIISDVWAKGQIAGSNDPADYRKDECGAWMYFSHYGNKSSQYGWEIDHITSVNHVASDDLNNLRPLQWQNYACKGSGELACIVAANKSNNGPTKIG